MQALAESFDYCPSCGKWAEALDDFTGWCGECSPQAGECCTTCGEQLPPNFGSTICASCKSELWLSRHTDELELLIVTKGYSFSRARVVVAEMIRPVCKRCSRVIKGGTPGETLFCKSNPKCHSAYRRYKRLVKAGIMSPEQALREVTSSDTVGT